MACGHLPTRARGGSRVLGVRPEVPGESAFAQNLTNVTKARPAITSYHQISRIMGEAIVKVMLGQGDPKTSLDDAANQVNRCWRPADEAVAVERSERRARPARPDVRPLPDGCSSCPRCS